ncbi:hypothetical protein [Paenibacillus prosopidis]|uniref:Uncharacterized protein n=1 Tax=Paenibacillus prosopidis TaxID=630520 RepID=A0A368VMG7_9BACL|nr:hypothetical protein [Paenibacillus prosopidis]RCW40897.1 hypothetical protein DFP97_12819 [Paenibacillus prosopidis]
MYIRFHGNYSSPYTNQPYGIFVVIFHLQRDGKLSDEDSKLYDETVDWFEEHLPNPPYYDEGNTIRAVTWFKENNHSSIMIKKLTAFFNIARKYNVEIIKSVVHEPPGEIVYEDEYQIGVVMAT